MTGGHARPARPGERFAVLGLARDFHAASGIPFDFDPAHASCVVADYIADPAKLALVWDVGGSPRGILAASAVPSPLAPVMVAQELIFWVDPAHRGRAGLRMVRAFEAWARERGCAVIGLSGLDDPRVSRFFAAAGFTLAENKFLKVV